MDWLTLSRVGLIINTTGAIALILGSNQAVDVMSKFIGVIGATYGTYGQGSVTKQTQKLTGEFIRAKKRATLFNTLGYALFIIGFILQLL
jgi:hypothetical protein